MRHRFSLGLGVVSAAAMAALTSIAAPANAQELAPGLACEGIVCQNDTENTYALSGTATCRQQQGPGGDSHTHWGTVTGRIAPHGQVTDLQVACFGFFRGGTFETATVEG